MIGKQGPGVDREPRHSHEGGQADHEVPAIPVIAEDGGPLDPPHHHMVEGPGRIQAGLAWHAGSVALRDIRVKLLPHQRPLLWDQPYLWESSPVREQATEPYRRMRWR